MGGKSNAVSSSSPVISSMALQTSCYGRPIPWVFGQQRIAPNLIQYEDFTPHASTSSQSSGKGGGSAPSTTTYSYTVAAIMALSTGPLVGIGQVWKDKDLTTISALQLDFYSGSNTQDAYPYFVSKHPDEALPYRGIAYVASGSYALDSSASLGNHTFEVQAEGSIASRYARSTVPDAEVADVVSAILTDVDQGLGLNPALIDDLTQFRSFCLANEIWISPAYSEQKGAFDYLKNLMTIGFADCVYSGGRFKVVPYSDVAMEGSLATYTPNVTIVADLAEDDFIGDASTDAITIAQKPSDESYNQVQVKFSDRANAYNDNIAESSDAADIDQFGLRPMAVVELREIADAAVAQKVADFLLQRSLYIVNTYTFKLSWKWIRLEPMDVVTLSYARKFMGQVPVLITAVSEDENGLLTVTAEDYPMGSSGPSNRAVPVIGSTMPNYASDPGNANAPLLFEPPGGLTNNDPEVWMATSGGAQWGGCVVWVSTDNQTYQQVGTVRSPARHGVLASELVVGPAIDTVDTLAVDLHVSNGSLSGTTQQNAQDLVTACYVDGEYIAYANAALTAANAYSLSYLVRGAYGSAIAAHAPGAPFTLLDGGIFKYTYPRSWVGKTIWVKLTSFNKFGNTLQDLSAVTAYEHTITGSPVASAGYLTTTGIVFGIEIDWGMPAAGAENLQCTELWYSNSPAFTSMTKLDSYASPQNTHTITGLAAGVTMYFWVRFLDQQGNTGAFYPSGDGVKGESSVDASDILSFLGGQIGKTQLAQDLLTPITQIEQIANIPQLLVDVQTLLDQVPDASTLQQITADQQNHDANSDALAANQLIALATADQALTAARTALLSQLGGNSAAIAQVQQALVNAQSATAQTITTVQAQFESSVSVLQTTQTAMSTAQTALASQVTTIAATANGNTAAIRDETTARETGDSANAQAITTMQAGFNQNLAQVNTQLSANSNALGSLANQINTVEATANGASSAVQTSTQAIATLDGKLSAMQTIKTQITVGGVTYIAGIGVGIDNSSGVVESQVLISAQKFALLEEVAGVASTPFVVLNGQTFINQAFIEDASITNAKIGALAVDTLNIAGNAVTVPVGARASGTPASCTVQLAHPGSVQVIGFANVNGSLSAGTNAQMIITMSGSASGTDGYVGIGIPPNTYGCLSTTGLFPNLAAGTYTFAITQSSVSGGVTLAGNSIIALGVMK